MYSPVKLNVPEKFHEKIKTGLSRDKPVSIKTRLEGEGNETVLLTRGQIAKIERAKLIGKKTISIRLSRKQVRVNIKHEGGFLGMLAGLAARILPSLLTGLATGAVSGAVEKAISGNGLFLTKRGHGCARIQLVKGNGLYLTHHSDNVDGEGIFLRHDDKIYRGEGLLLGPNSPFKNVPLLGLLL